MLSYPLSGGNYKFQNLKIYVAQEYPIYLNYGDTLKILAIVENLKDSKSMSRAA